MEPSTSSKWRGKRRRRADCSVPANEASQTQPIPGLAAGVEREPSASEIASRRAGERREGDGDEASDGGESGEDVDDEAGDKAGEKEESATGNFEDDEWEEGEVERGMLHALVELGHLEMLLHQVC